MNRKCKSIFRPQNREIFLFVKHGQILGIFTIRNMPGTNEHVLYNITYRNISNTCPESDKGILMWKIGEGAV